MSIKGVKIIQTIVPHTLQENTECALRNNRIKHLINVESIDIMITCKWERMWIYQTRLNMITNTILIYVYSAGSLLKNNKRAMTLTRASFAGTGQFAGHFLGRNKATWEDMYQSMIGELYRQSKWVMIEEKMSRNELLWVHFRVQLAKKSWV